MPRPNIPHNEILQRASGFPLPWLKFTTQRPLNRTVRALWTPGRKPTHLLPIERKDCA